MVHLGLVAQGSADAGVWPMMERRDDESITAFTIRRIRSEIIEECAKEAERGYFLSDMIRCAGTLDDCAARIRALGSTPTGKP